jgi:hypothetical protein
LNGLNSDSDYEVSVYDSGLKRLGALPKSTVSMFVKLDGSRVYTFDDSPPSGSSELRTYDLTKPVTNDLFPQVGTGVPLSVSSDRSSVEMFSTPDGATLFIVGPFGLVVQPTPQ